MRCMSVLHLTADEARAKIEDPLTARIAESLWGYWGYTDDQTREYVDSPNGDGQWNYCVADAEFVAELFREMVSEQG